MIELLFRNADAKPKEVRIKTRRADAPDIIRWYSAYCAGDRFRVFANGVEIKIINGEIINGEPLNAKLLEKTK